MLQAISGEQACVISCLEHGNCLVNSVAGAGKTTTALHIALHFSKSKILHLTYNSRLRHETRARAQKAGICNMDVHTFHSFAVRYYDPTTINDMKLKCMLESKTLPSLVFYYDIIIIDEAQDLVPLYYQLIYRLYMHNQESHAKLCLFGDERQCIYAFKQADNRYLKLAPSVFDLNPMPWSACNLTTSFRSTRANADFINNCMLRSPWLDPHVDGGEKPRYLQMNSFDTFILCDELFRYLESGYEPSDIFVLAPSLKTRNSPVRQFENQIKHMFPEVLVHVPVSDDVSLKDECMTGKLVFSTFHQAKGLERKVCIIFSFDSSYFWYNKPCEYHQTTCPNELYVAVTRATKCLTLVHHFKNEPLPFVDQHKLAQYCTKIDYNQLQANNRELKPPIPQAVTQVTRFLSSDLIADCLELLNLRTVRKENTPISIPQLVHNKGCTESVYEINGTLIPLFFELQLTGWADCLNELAIEKDAFDSESIADVCRLATAWTSKKSGYIFKTFQIHEHNWIAPAEMTKCMQRMTSLGISKDAKFEKHLTFGSLNGYVDCIDGNNIYEFKCSANLKAEDFLQLTLYMHMHEKDIEKKRPEIIQKLLEVHRLSEDEAVHTDATLMYLTKSGTCTGQVHCIQANGTIVLKTDQGRKIKRKRQNLFRLHDIEMPQYKYFVYNILTDELVQIDTKHSAIVYDKILHAPHYVTPENDEAFVAEALSLRKQQQGILASSQSVESSINITCVTKREIKQQPPTVEHGDVPSKLQVSSPVDASCINIPLFHPTSRSPPNVSNILTHTFIHLPQLGDKKELQLWQQGIKSHSALLKTCNHLKRSTSLRQTISAIQEHDVAYFAEHLATKDHWRLFGDFASTTCYLDIETTGLSMCEDVITTAVVHSQSGTHVFINGLNLHMLPTILNQHDLVVTYNGKAFDIPFIEALCDCKIRTVHLDLRYILASLGFRGGLKRCEHDMNMAARPSNVKGSDAPILWHNFKVQNDSFALLNLIAYNFEDSVRLEILMHKTYRLKLEQLNHDKCLGEFKFYDVGAVANPFFEILKEYNF